MKIFVIGSSGNIMGSPRINLILHVNIEFRRTRVNVSSWSSMAIIFTSLSASLCAS
jgi:hypothetical protein